MADFCRQCSRDILGMPDHSDMNGLITEEQYQLGFVATALCEGCGGGEFSPDGTCLGGCEKHPLISSPGFEV